MLMTKPQMDRMLGTGQGGDVVSVYMFYYYTAKWQDTNQPYCTVEYIAQGLGISKDRVRKAREHLLELGYIEDIQTKGTEGKFGKRYVKINYIPSNRTLDYRTTEKPYYGKTDTNALSSNNKNALSSNNKILVQEFEELWKKYPRKEGRAQAWNHYKSARTSKGISYEDINKGLDNYVEYIKQNKTEARYIKMGSTWFNGHWEDEYDIVKKEELPDFDWGEIL